MRIFLLLSLLSSTAFAAEADLFQDLFAAPKRPGNNRVSYEGQLYEKENVQGKAAALSLQKHRMRASHTLRNDPTFLNVEGNVELDQTKTTAVFPDSRNALPKQLWNVSLSGNYRKPLEGERSIGASLGVGSPSDKPFRTMREVSLSANFTYRFPAGKAKDQWLVLVNESNTRGFLPWIPIPGVGYLFDRSDSWKLFVGAPVLGFFWRPGGKWFMSGFYFPVQSGQVEISYYLFGPARAYFGFRSGQDVFLRAGRDDKRDRLFAVERDLHLGFTMPLNAYLLMDLGARYTFKRGYYEGKGFGDRKTGRRLDVESASSFGLKLVALF